MIIADAYNWLNKEKARYYTVVVKKYRESSIILKYTWGSSISNRGGQKNIMVNSEEEAAQYIKQLIKRRKSRGYQLIAPVM